MADVPALIEKNKSYVAVNPVILTIADDTVKVLLYQREKEPFRGLQELPGGLMRADETANETLKRKLQEVVGNERIFFTQFNVFTNPKRDPRQRAVSIGYVALIPRSDVPTGMWVPFDSLPPLAFDHAQIIACALQYLKEHISSQLVRHLLPATFPLNSLQRIYELIEGKIYDNRNFRKWVIAAGIVVATNKMEKDVSHRPAKLYRFA